MQFRAHPLDGATLYFDRTTGTHVRLEGPAYAASTRRAPRVVQLGLTNRCNLRCSFCFRDRTLTSTWTRAEILAWASALADMGVLELGFGQGEPLLFSDDFPALVRSLARETPLAINFTTNGLRLDDARLDEFDGAYGQLRLSYYDDNDPLARVRLLARRKARFGVNLLVTPDRLPRLGAMIEELVDAGCRDVLLLGYNGPDPALQLAPTDDRRLAAIILELHARLGRELAIGLSVCFGRRLLEVPQLPTGNDCGAGDDFITIDSEKRLLPCSFHATAITVESPTHALAIWRAHRARRTHAGLDGCARVRLPLARAPALLEMDMDTSPRVLVWQSFASNHSSSYTLVGEFSTAAKSAAYVAEIQALLERCSSNTEHERRHPDRPAPQNLWQLLGRDGDPPAAAWLVEPRNLAFWRPDAVLAGGRRVLVHADSTLQTFGIFTHLLLRRHGRILQSDDRWGRTPSFVFGVEAGDAIEAVRGRLDPSNTKSHVVGTRLYAIIESHAIEYAAPIFRPFPFALANLHDSDETLASALADRQPLPSRKRRTEWTLIEGLPIDNWNHQMEQLAKDPVGSLARIDWHHPYRMPDRLDAHPLLGSTIVRSEGAPFPAALQAWFSTYRMQLVAGPALRIRVMRWTGSEATERPFEGLTPEHIAGLSRPGGSFTVLPYRSFVDILPRNPKASFAQLDAILGHERQLALAIMAARPLADALARIDADLDAGKS